MKKPIKQIDVLLKLLFVQKYNLKWTKIGAIATAIGVILALIFSIIALFSTRTIEVKEGEDVSFQETSGVKQMQLPLLRDFSKGVINAQNDPPRPSVLRTVTAYTLRPEETDDTPCIGAWGDNLCELKEKTRIGFGAICASNEFPRGTKLWIRTEKGWLSKSDDGWVNPCVVYDRMNSRYKNRIDILFDNYQDAINFGVQELEVEIIN